MPTIHEHWWNNQYWLCPCPIMTILSELRICNKNNNRFTWSIAYLWYIHSISMCFKNTQVIKAHRYSMNMLTIIWMRWKGKCKLLYICKKIYYIFMQTGRQTVKLPAIIVRVNTLFWIIFNTNINQIHCYSN